MDKEFHSKINSEKKKTKIGKNTKEKKGEKEKNKIGNDFEERENKIIEKKIIKRKEVRVTITFLGKRKDKAETKVLKGKRE